MPLVSLKNTITLAISVQYRHASVQRYSDKLGFERIRHVDEAGWSEIHTKTEGVALGLGEQAEPAPGNAVPVFGVDDIATAHGSREAAGVEFDGDTETIEGMVSTAAFYGPAGNAMMLAEDLTGQ